MCDSLSQTIMHQRDLMTCIHTYQEVYFVGYIFIVIAWASKMQMSLHKESN
jgi:hypothetical protein